MDAPIIVFAPGAGASSKSPWMQAWAKRLGALGPVVTFDYAYMAAGRKRPDRLPALIEAHRLAVERARAEHGATRPVVLIGKSMGGRIGCYLAVELAAAGASPIVGLVCLGYPLRSQTGTLRDEVLLALSTPVLFVQGTRDPLCDVDELEQVRARMRAPNELLVVAGGDHSLTLRVRDQKAIGQTQDECDATTFEAIRAFSVMIAS